METESCVQSAWKSGIEESSKCLNYTIFKTEHCLVTLNDSCLQTCINFRTSNNYLPIETGSLLRIERNERKQNNIPNVT